MSKPPEFSITLWFGQVVHCIHCGYSWYLKVVGLACGLEVNRSTNRHVTRT